MLQAPSSLGLEVAGDAVEEEEGLVDVALEGVHVHAAHHAAAPLLLLLQFEVRDGVGERVESVGNALLCDSCVKRRSALMMV